MAMQDCFVSKKHCPDEEMAVRTRELLPPVDARTMAGKVICGYQGWFGTPSDPAEGNYWRHWGGGTPEHLERISFELYPDTREYDPATIHPTGHPDLGDGRKAGLFSSGYSSVIDTHFRWMAEYGIDGVALQRFFGDIPNPRMRQVMADVRTAAEKYGRVFYVCYDISGGRGDHFVDRMCEDIDRLSDWVLESPAYLYEGDRPVLQLWGFGVRGNCRCEVEQAMAVAEYAKKKGFYLIAGTPAQFRESGPDSLPEFAPVYDYFDMISPWQVGRFARPEQVPGYYEHMIQPDGEYCAAKGQDYMPVLFAGFAWSLWLNGPANAIPRLGGRFLWEQAKAAAKAQTTALYIAMFDEYDESTAIMKAAEDSSQIPQGRYFLTTCADGEFVSGDFYLRLVGKLTSLYKEKAPLPNAVPVPLAEGPVYMRTGFETDTDPLACLSVIEGKQADVNLEVRADDHAHGGQMVVKVRIIPTTLSTTRVGILDTGRYTITPTMTLRGFVRTQREGDGQLLWDVQTEDGIWLSEAEMPSMTVSEADEAGWQKIILPVGSLAGKTIKTVGLTYTGSMPIELLVDDVLLYEA